MIVDKPNKLNEGNELKNRKASQLRFTDLCTPGMGVISWGASPLYETGSLKEVNIPNDRSD